MFRNRFAPGTKAQPHSHPDTRFTYVLSGTLYVGFGRTFDPTKMRAIPTGAVYVAPARIPHFVWAKEGEVVFQETGLGPTATDFVERRPP
jgi:quercetin dioxygenase-like cupin family protein